MSKLTSQKKLPQIRCKNNVFLYDHGDIGIVLAYENPFSKLLQREGGSCSRPCIAGIKSVRETVQKCLMGLFERMDATFSPGSCFLHRHIERKSSKILRGLLCYDNILISVESLADASDAILISQNIFENFCVCIS